MSRPALSSPPRYPAAVLGGVWAEELAANGAAAPTNRHMRYDGVWPPRAPSSAPPGPRICTQCWLGRPLPNLATHGAIFARTASRRETRTTHRPTSHGPLQLLFVSDRRRPCGLRYPTLRWSDRLETAPKKTIVAHFAWFLAVFSTGGSPFAAAVFATRSPAARAHDVD